MLKEGVMVMSSKTAQMDILKMEKQVKSNTSLLDKELGSIIKTNSGKYIVFHNGSYFITKTLDSGLQKGIKEFGENVGFVLKKLQKSNPILSSLIKL